MMGAGRLFAKKAWQRRAGQRKQQFRPGETTPTNHDSDKEKRRTK